MLGPWGKMAKGIGPGPGANPYSTQSLNLAGFVVLLPTTGSWIAPNPVRQNLPDFAHLVNGLPQRYKDPSYIPQHPHKNAKRGSSPRLPNG